MDQGVVRLLQVVLDTQVSSSLGGVPYQGGELVATCTTAAPPPPLGQGEKKEHVRQDVGPLLLSI